MGLKSEIKLTLKSILLFGTRFHCPVCGNHFRKMMPIHYSRDKRENAICPRCFCFERHRLIYLFLQNRTDFFTKPYRVLHFAPKEIFAKKFKKCKNLDYITADLMASNVMYKMDITDIQFEDNAFDVILCNHVLEHVPDDKQAMRELFRVMRPGGWGIIISPLERSRSETYEDLSVTDPQERLRLFHHEDHVRIYGTDYKDRLQAAGFEVDVINYFSELPQEAVEKYSLIEDDDIYLCRKPQMAS